MVVIFLPTASLTEVWQDRTASPLTWTVQAPQRPAPQPNFVPVICNCSRMTQSSGVSLAASTDIFRPLIFKVVMFPPKGGVYRLTWPSAYPAMSLHLFVEILFLRAHDSRALQRSRNYRRQPPNKKLRKRDSEFCEEGRATLSVRPISRNDEAGPSGQ